MQMHTPQQSFFPRAYIPKTCMSTMLGYVGIVVDTTPYPIYSFMHVCAYTQDKMGVLQRIHSGSIVSVETYSSSSPLYHTPKKPRIKLLVSDA